MPKLDTCLTQCCYRPEIGFDRHCEVCLQRQLAAMTDERDDLTLRLAGALGSFESAERSSNLNAEAAIAYREERDQQPAGQGED